jgi:tetratricopeptide (TPR) repeat protein
VGIVRVALPANHPDLGIYLQNLGAMYRAWGKYVEADRAYREATTACEQAFGKDAWETGVARACLGSNLVALGRQAEAEPALLDALRVFEASRATESRDQCIGKLVNLYNTWEQAEPGKGYGLKAAQWQTKLPATRPATTQS